MKRFKIKALQNIIVAGQPWVKPVHDEHDGL